MVEIEKKALLSSEVFAFFDSSVLTSYCTQRGKLTENGRSTCWPWTPSDGSLLFLPRFDDRDCLSADVLPSVRAKQLWFG